MASRSLIIPVILIPSRLIHPPSTLTLRLNRFPSPNFPFFPIFTRPFRPKRPLRDRKVCSAVFYDSNEFSEARDAVIELLRECGVNEENAKVITAKSPNYVQMVVENVRELDELGLWGSWSAELGELGEEDVENLGFGRKVYWMAKSKGDGGLLPFLESVGLKLSSALLIARYLSGEKLCEVIEKVKFLKEILFSSSSGEDRFGKKARSMMMHLSIPIDEEIQSTLSFFEKMEARCGGINMLGQKEASFPYLIESFPKLLLRSPELHFKPLIDYLQLLGISKEGISSVLMSFPPIMFYDVDEDLKPKLLELQKAGVTDRDHGKMLLKYPWILSTSIQENYEQILAYFNEEKHVIFSSRFQNLVSILQLLVGPQYWVAQLRR